MFAAAWQPPGTGLKASPLWVAGHRREALLPAFLWLSLCSCAGDSAAGRAAPPRLTNAIDRFELPRTIEPRLSVSVSYRSSIEANATPSPAILEVAEQAARRLRAQADPDALHAAALIDLAWSEYDGIALQRSVSYLQTASRMSNSSAAIMADLAAALLVRAERHRQPRDLLEAIETADGAVELDPRSAAARYNLALGLERLGLEAEAWRAWKEFLTVDLVSPWAAEIRRRRASTRPPERPEPQPDASRADIAAYVADEPGAAMFLGFDRTLGAWGQAILGGDTLRADSLLRFARTIGEELERTGRDASLAKAARTIDRTLSTPAGRNLLARAHRDYSAALRTYRAGDTRAADRQFARVDAAATASPLLRLWARHHRAAALVQQGRTAPAESLLRALLTEVDTLRYPSLAGRTLWVMATLALRAGRYEGAMHAARSAAPLLARAGERENVGAVQTIAADAEQYLPDRTAVYTAVQEALTTLQPFRRSVWLHNVLYNLARLADADRLPRLAIRAQSEGLEVAESIGQPLWIAEARIARARLLATAGQRREAEADLAAARPLVATLSTGGAREWFEADLRLSEAVASLTGDPARAVEGADSAARFFEDRQNVIRLLPALVTRASAALSLGNVGAATADLDRVLELLDRQGGEIGSIELRASLLEGARQVVDQLVMLRVHADRPRVALEALERARLSLVRVARRSDKSSAVALELPPGHLAAEYALIGDTLLVWTVVGTRVHLEQTTVDRSRLTGTIERVRAALELRTAMGPALERDLALLYDWLIRPVRRDFAPPDAPFLLVTDREIGSVPFAALRDSSRKRYLIEEHPVRFASSLADASANSPAAKRGQSEVLLVADPAFEASAFPGLARLPGAAAEARAIAAYYPNTKLLDGPAASRHAFTAAVQRVGIVHYAGHAVFDDERPEQSLLVLAPDGGSEAGTRLTAAEIERLDLASLRLVVLSACETIRSRTGRSGGFAGFARAFLAAGAGGVVGSLWRVEDQQTRALMESFHRAYSQSGDGAVALRVAQLELIRSGDPASSAPAAWAGFRYAGQ
jgi:CHAT domain-containing protein